LNNFSKGSHSLRDIPENTVFYEDNLKISTAAMKKSIGIFCVNMHSYEDFAILKGLDELHYDHLNAK